MNDEQEANNLLRIELARLEAEIFRLKLRATPGARQSGSGFGSSLA